MLHTKLKGYLVGYVPLNLIQALTALGIVVIYTRLLSPEQYGLYALAIIGVQWLQTLLFYWLHGGVVRFYEARRAENRLSPFLGAIYSAALSLCAVLAMAAGLAMLGLGAPWRYLLLAGVTSLIARSLLLIGLEGHRAARKVARYTGLEGSHYLLTLGLGTLLVTRTDGGAAAALWGAALASLIVLLFDRPRGVRIRAWSTPDLRQVAHYGMPLAAAALLSQVLASSDRFFITWLIDAKAVGLYSVAYALADRPSAIIFNWVAMAALPLAFAAMAHDGPAAARQVMENTGKTLILVMLPCTAGLAAVAAPLAEVLVGVEFRAETARLIPWIALASLLFGSMAHYSSHAFQIAEKPRLLLYAYLLTLAINMALNLLLIPPFGLEGAVAASIGTYGAGFLFQLFLSRTFLAIPLPVSDFVRGIVACIIMVATIRSLALPLTPTGLVSSILIGILSYGASALVLNVSNCRTWVSGRWRRAQTGETPP